MRTHTVCIYSHTCGNYTCAACGWACVALQVTRRLKDMGCWVWQMQRGDARRKELEAMMVVVAKGDALNRADVDRVYQSESAVKNEGYILAASAECRVHSSVGFARSVLWHAGNQSRTACAIQRETLAGS